MEIENIISFIFHPVFSGWLLYLKILFILTSLLLLGFIIFALIKTSWLKRLIIWDWIEFFSYSPYGARKIVKTWAKITSRLKSGLESEYKLAVIEADSIVNDILKRIGFKGETLGEKLEKLTVTILPNLEQTKQAHKSRNEIIHNTDYKLDLNEAKKILNVYEQALRDLHAF